MVWIRPTAAEIDNLEALGNPGWNWQEIEPYLFAIESNIPPTESQIEQGAGLNPSVHGFQGAVNVSFPTPMRVPSALALYKEAFPLTFPGLVISNDFSNRSPDQTVSASTSWTLWFNNGTDENLRSSAADGLLWASDQQRDSLTVLKNHKVDKVLLSASGNLRNLAADGVVFGIQPGNSLRIPGSLPGWYTVYARREVILAAGALASASIIERSGIGNASVLDRAGVQSLVDLPGVGSNLVDQPGTGTAALVADDHQNDTSIIDGRPIFGPLLTQVSTKQIWPDAAEDYFAQLTSAENLHSRAEALVSAGAAVNVKGAMAILNATIDLIVSHGFPVAEI